MSEIFFSSICMGMDLTRRGPVIAKISAMSFVLIPITRSIFPNLEYHANSFICAALSANVGK
jgi:hypothetical protein